MALLARVVSRLRREHENSGKTDFFEQAKGFLMGGEGSVPYAQVAQALGMEEGALRVAVHRMRKRYRELLRDEIAETLSDPKMLDEELRALQAALAR